MRLAGVLDVAAFAALMNWEDLQKNNEIRYVVSTDGNKNGLTPVAFGKDGNHVDDIAIYGENPVVPWLQQFATELDNLAQQLTDQGITQTQ